ncbi:MAG TPA: DNA polymerase III subunit gamma/tau [Planctomycetaceae bacterium]|nr:DNA polymerase III subunit gamma/tau [Planctomycetaceae bacterium]
MEAAYTALARRFRPQTFSEVVGQDRIAQTLRNAIHEGRVAHAYLFTGARGVGKTSMARIFAKALNCPNAVDAVPCNQCEVCQGIAAGQDVDVSEIDGASNRGIDDIRALRANVHVRSMRSKYKIYIVDEVHMLTKEAFNALLKTLEEPPPSVKFIFCTTEPNKVPDTILSRCQRFDFGTIATDNIMGRLQQLADAEGFEVEKAALELVARRAAGSMRDSQSLFDQLLAFGAHKITAADVHRLLGTAPDERLIDLAQTLIDRRRDLALEQFHRALQDGVQLEPLFDQLIAYTRDLMVTATGSEAVSLTAVGSDRRPEVAAQAQAWGLQTIVAALEILAETKLKMQRTTMGRALAELALMRVSLLKDLDRLDDLIAQLKSGAIVSAGGAATRTVAAPAMPSTARNLGTVEKKTAEPVTGSAVDDSSPQTQPIEPVVVWGPNCGAEILNRLQARFPDIIGTYLRQVLSTAISGPNLLEFSFPAGYDMGRKACQRPEVLSQIEAAVHELTGESIRLRFGIASGSVAPPPTVAAPPTTPTARRSVEEPTDPLVQEVGKTFGVDLWRVHEIGRVAIPDADTEEEVA